VDRSERSTKTWLRLVRELRDRGTRLRDGLCYVEGIRQVLAAAEGGHRIEVLLVDPSRLRSPLAWEQLDQLQAAGVPMTVLGPEEFERISSRDNPVGLAAVVRWRAQPLTYADVAPDGVYLVADDVRDPGNLGTLIRTADGLGGAGVIIHGGTDAGHPTAIRASLGSLFRLPVYQAETRDDLFFWAGRNGVTTVATTAKANTALWDAPVGLPVALLLGNEAEGLSEETRARCDLEVGIPMTGAVSSLNVSVAAGIFLYELQRRKALNGFGEA
jgi:TrmH family RNA methyltransferase